MIHPLIASAVEPARTPTGKVRMRRGQPVMRKVLRLADYEVQVSVPLVLPLTGRRLAKWFLWPEDNQVTKAR